MAIQITRKRALALLGFEVNSTPSKDNILDAYLERAKKATTNQAKFILTQANVFLGLRIKQQNTLSDAIENAEKIENPKITQDLTNEIHSQTRLLYLMVTLGGLIAASTCIMLGQPWHLSLIYTLSTTALASIYPVRNIIRSRAKLDYQTISTVVGAPAYEKLAWDAGLQAKEVWGYAKSFINYYAYRHPIAFHAGMNSTPDQAETIKRYRP